MNKTECQNFPYGDRCAGDDANGLSAGEPICALRLIEIGLWTALALTPFLYWINGPAVSHDQFFVRGFVVLIVIIGLSVLRLRAWIRPR
jgi:high-affinity Fe2+/Pb2+ permease